MSDEDVLSQGFGGNSYHLIISRDRINLDMTHTYVFSEMMTNGIKRFLAWKHRTAVGKRAISIVLDGKAR